MSDSFTQRNHVYVLAVQNALFAFQMIEEALKIYIRGSYEIIKRSVPSPVAFNFDASAIKNAPLGKLIKMFSGISANNKLIGDLRKIEEWRNFCAHRAYTHEFMRRQSGTPVSAKDVEDVATVANFAIDLVNLFKAANDQALADWPPPTIAEAATPSPSPRRPPRDAESHARDRRRADRDAPARAQGGGDQRRRVAGRSMIDDDRGRLSVVGG
jgi:hypothetical protein